MKTAIQASTNLPADSWVSLLTTNLVTGLLAFGDAASTNHPLRFYRVAGP